MSNLTYKSPFYNTLLPFFTWKESVYYNGIPSPFTNFLDFGLIISSRDTYKFLPSKVVIYISFTEIA